MSSGHLEKDLFDSDLYVRYGTAGKKLAPCHRKNSGIA